MGAVVELNGSAVQEMGAVDSVALQRHYCGSILVDSED